jgi:hypothetical protein
MGQPANTNFLSQFGFRLVIMRLPEIEYMLQRVNVPGLNVGAANRTTPFASPVPYPGDITFNDLTFSFKVDEALDSYFSIWEWMIALGFPENFDQYKELATRNRFPKNFEEGEVTSDISLLLLDNKQNAKFKFNFMSCWPTSISDLIFNSTDTTVNYVTAEVTMKYTLYTFEKIN